MSSNADDDPEGHNGQFIMFAFAVLKGPQLDPLISWEFQDLEKC